MVCLLVLGGSVLTSEGAKAAEGTQSAWGSYLPPTPWEEGEPPLARATLERMAELNADRESWLESNEAETERADSTDEFISLGAASASDVLVDTFEPLFASLGINADDPLSSVDEVKSFRDDYTAKVDPAGPKDHGLLVSNAPLRTEHDLPIDTDLETSGGEVIAVAPATKATLPLHSDSAFTLPDENVSFELDGAAGPASEVEMVDPPQGVSGDSELAFYANTQTDTDTAAAIVPGGIETFTQLRSENSPEEISMTFDVPQGGGLQLVEGAGASITNSENEEVAFVYAPFSVDAQGQDVPTTFDVDGETLSIQIEHVDEGFAYPILVDPLVESRDWWNNINDDLMGWGFQQSGTTQYNWNSVCPPALAGISNCLGTGKGLYASAAPGKTFPAGSMGYWSWQPPGASTYILTAGVTSWVYRKGATNGNPYAFLSLGGGGSWTTNADGGGGGVQLWGTPGVRTFNSGLATNSTVTMPSGNANWRYFRMSTWGMVLMDQEDPNLDTLDSSGMPSSWMDNNVPFNIKATAHDAGLGVQAIFNYLNGAWAMKWPGWCSGNWAAPCYPHVNGAVLNYNTSSFAQGKTQVPVSAGDAGGRPSNNQIFTVKKDSAPPTVTVGGTITQTATVGSDRPSYTLQIDARDGTATVPASGVVEVVVKLDGDTLSTFSQSCPTQNCFVNLNEPVVIDAADAGLGPHLLTVTAKDALNHTSPPVQVNFTLTEDTTVPIVTSIDPIFDPGSSTSSSGPEIEFESEDAGTGIDHVSALVGEEVVGNVSTDNECYSGGCGFTSSMTLDLAGLPEGPQEISLVVVDRAGNVSLPFEGTLTSDTQTPELALTGTLPDHDQMPVSGGVLSADIEASDPSGAFDSGIASVTVYVDSVEQFAEQGNCQNGCPAELDTNFDLDFDQLTDQVHEVAFVARDGAGNTERVAIDVDVPEIADAVECPTEAPDVLTAPSGFPSGEEVIDEIETSSPELIEDAEVFDDPESGDPISPAFDNPEPEASYEVEGAITQTESSGEELPTVNVGEIACLQPTTTTTAAEAPIVVEEDVLVYPNSAPDTDTVVRATAQGVAMVQVLRSPAAPMTFSWNFGVEDELIIDPFPGGIAVLDPHAVLGISNPNAVDPGWGFADLVEVERQMEDGTYLLDRTQARVPNSQVTAVFPDPVARDANGIEIPVSYSYANGVITMNINPSSGQNPAYPVEVMSRAASRSNGNDCRGSSAPCGSVNRAKLQEYAYRWGDGRNPKFKDYGGSDCTNYMSQLLHAGRVEYMNEFRDKDDMKSWWFETFRDKRTGIQILRHTKTFSLADRLPTHLYRHYLSGFYSHNQHDWRVADMVLFQWRKNWDGDKEIDHLSMVSDVYKGVVRMTNHSSATKNYSRRRWTDVRAGIEGPWNYKVLRNYHTGGDIDKTRSGM